MGRERVLEREVGTWTAEAPSAWFRGLILETWVPKAAAKHRPGESLREGSGPVCPIHHPLLVSYRVH